MRTVVLGEPPPPVAEWLERRRALGQDLFVPTAAIIVEIVSPGDETYVKPGFYFSRGVEELLIVGPLDRSVQWYGRGAEALVPSGRSGLLELTEADLHAAIDWPPSG